jgi:hypothetical protein
VTSTQREERRCREKEETEDREVRVHTATLCAIEIYCCYIEFPFSFYADVDTRVVVTNERGAPVASTSGIPDPDEITVDISDVQVYRRRLPP